MSTVTHNLADLTSALQQYQLLSGKTNEDVLKKQGAKLAREIHYSLRAIAPLKGSLKLALLARLRSGRMIKIRDAVRDRVKAKWESKLKTSQRRVESKSDSGVAPGKLNWKWKLHQKMVQAEIGLRVKGVGIMGLTTKYRTTGAFGVKAISKYGFLLSDLGIKVWKENGMAQIRWPDVSDPGQRINEGLRRSRPHRAVESAIESVRQDVLVYVRRKQQELIVQSVRGMIRGIA